MSTLEVLVSFFGVLGSLIGWVSIREKRGMRVELSAQKELAQVRADYRARIEALEEHMQAQRNMTDQFRRMNEERHRENDRLKERVLVLEETVAKYEKILMREGLMTPQGSIIPRPQMGGK